MITVGQLKEMLKDIPDSFPIYLSAENSAGDFASGDVVSVIISCENDVVLSNVEWEANDRDKVLA